VLAYYRSWLRNLNFMMLLNVNITLKSTHEMQGACILQFMTTKYRAPPKNPLWGPNPIMAETDKTGAYLATSHWLHESSIPTAGHGQIPRFPLPKSMIAPLELGSNLKWVIHVAWKWRFNKTSSTQVQAWWLITK
jgi:hypothetical protein